MPSLFVFMTIKGLYNKVKQLNTDRIIEKVFEENIDTLNEKNKEQLLAGKNRLGEDIGPTYFEDPYFKTPAAAIRYSDWKDRITPNSKRKRGVPNLYIDGTYHNSRKTTISGDTITYTADFLEQEIEAKYGDQINGLGGEFKSEFLENNIRPAINKEITAVTGLQFK